MTWDLESRLELLANAINGRAFCAGPARWLTRELVLTEAAVERLRAWCVGGGFDRPAPDIRSTAKYYGDASLLPIVVDALGILAPPARDFVLDHAAIYGAGWDSYAWIGAQPKPADQIIVIDGSRRDDKAIRQTMLHELAHCWLLDLPRHAHITAAQTVDFEASCLAAGRVPFRATAQSRTDEWQATALAADWARRAARGQPQ